MTDILIDVTVRKTDNSASLTGYGYTKEAVSAAIEGLIAVVQSGQKVSVGRVRRLPDSRPQPAGRKRRAPEAPAQKP